MSMQRPGNFLRPTPIQVHPTTAVSHSPQQSRRPSQSQSAQSYHNYQPVSAPPAQLHQPYSASPYSTSSYVPHSSPPPPTHQLLHPSALQSHSQRPSVAGGPLSNSSNSSSTTAALPPPPLQRLMSEFDTSSSLEASADAPTIAKAVNYRNMTCPRQHKTQMWTLSTLTDDELMKYGVGTRLYFQQLRRLGWVFFVMFIFAIPSFMFNVRGDGVNTGYVLTKMTLGNQGVANTTATSNSTSSSSSSSSSSSDSSSSGDTIYGYDKQTIGLVISLCDLAATLIFLLSLLKAAIDHRRVTAAYHSSILTVSRYSVAVTNLPKHATDRLSLKQHFTQFGPVVDVSILYSNFALVELYVERGRQRKLLADAEHNVYQSHNKQHAEKLVEECMKKVAVVDHQIAVERAMVGTWPVTAYVTFEQQTDSDKCLRQYIDNFWYWLLLPMNLRYHGKRVRVRRAPEPSNILYHNLSYTSNAKRVRRFLTAIVSIALLSVTTGVVYAAQYVHNNKIPQVVGCDGTDKVNDGTFDVVTAYYNNKDGSYSDEINCYCSQLSLSALILDQQYCTAYIKSYALNNALILLTAFTTIATNVLIQYAVTKISQFERHTSRSSQQLTMAYKLSIGLILNTGIIIVLVNADLSTLLNPLGLAAISNSSGYSDLTVYWYNSVGSSVTITMFIGIFNPACLQLGHILYDYYKRNKYLQPQAPDGKQHNPMRDIKNQDELNKAFQGRAFTLDVRYSHLLVTVSICYMYAGGIPLMLLIASVSLFMTYFCDKLSFCLLYRIPPRYDEHLDGFALHALPIAALLHCVMNVGYYSSIVMESYTISTSLTSYFDYQRLVNQYGINHIPFDVSDRLNQYNVLPFVILTVLLVLFYLARPLIALLSLLPCIPNERKDPLALILPNYFGQLGSRPSYYEAVRRVKLESYRLSRQQHWRLAYLVTGSRKQMPKDDEFDSVGQKLREIKGEKGWGKRGSATAGGEESDGFGYGMERGSVSMLAGPLQQSLQYSVAQPVMAWRPAGGTAKAVKANDYTQMQSHARMVSNSYLSPYNEDSGHEPSHSHTAVSSAYRPPSPDHRKASMQLPNVVELDELGSPPAYSPPQQHLRAPSTQHSRSASSTPQTQPRLIVLQRGPAGAGGGQAGLALVAHKHSYSDAPQLLLAQPRSARGSPAAPPYRSMPAASNYPISRTQPPPSAHFSTSSAPVFATMQPSPVPTTRQPLTVAVPPPGATYPATPLSPGSPMSPTAKAASAKLLSTLSLGDLTQMSQHSLSLLWAQYAGSPTAERLKRRQLKQLATDCVDRVLQQLTNDLRKQHNEWGEREVREAVRKELKFVIAGVKEGDGMDEMARAMAGRLVRKLDVNGDGEISRTELLVSWNAFSSELFAMKKEQSDGSLECCVM